MDVIDRVRRALRREVGQVVPPPPEIAEPITRLVHTEIALEELFAKRAMENKMGVEMARVEDLPQKVAAFLREAECRRIAMPASPLLDRAGITPKALREAGFDARSWEEITLDELYDYDCGLTDVWCGVAETGSLAIRSSPRHGRSLSLVPPVHVAILEPQNFVPDLVDFFEKVAKEGVGGGISLITGPSKTADIEMNLIEGVHGPGKVQLFILE